MAVYLVVEIEIKDQELYSDYVNKVYDIVTAYGGKYIVRGGRVMLVSGNWNPERIIMVEFPNIQQMQNCFQSPQYLEIASLREQSTMSKAIVVEGYNKALNHFFNIRAATLSDTEKIFQTHKASIERLCKYHYSPKDIEAWTGILSPNIYEEAIKEKITLVAEKENEILGFGILHIASNELSAIYVHPEFMGKSVGKEILLKLEAAASENGVTRLSLCSTINAFGFYKRHKYVEDGTAYHELPGGVQLKCIRMHRDFDKYKAYG